MVSAGDRFVGQLVEAQRQSLGESPAVDEHDRRVVLADEAEHLRVERGPDRMLGGVAGALYVGHRLGRLLLRRQLDAQVQLLAHAGVDDAHLAVASDEAPDLLERPLRGRERDALRVVLAQIGESLERERQVSPSFGCCDCVHLVDDHGLDAGQQLARARREHQIEAFRRRDEDVGRRAQHAPALLRRGVARTHRDARRSQMHAAGGGRRPDARERHAEIALDVVVERLERRDVEHPQPLAGLGQHAVEEPQERGQRLA